MILIKYSAIFVASQVSGPSSNQSQAECSCNVFRYNLLRHNWPLPFLNRPDIYQQIIYGIKT